MKYDICKKTIGKHDRRLYKKVGKRRSYTCGPCFDETLPLLTLEPLKPTFPNPPVCTIRVDEETPDAWIGRRPGYAGAASRFPKFAWKVWS